MHPTDHLKLCFPCNISIARKYSADNLEVPLDIDFGEHFL